MKTSGQNALPLIAITLLLIAEDGLVYFIGRSSILQSYSIIEYVISLGGLIFFAFIISGISERTFKKPINKQLRVLTRPNVPKMRKFFQRRVAKFLMIIPIMGVENLVVFFLGQLSAKMEFPIWKVAVIFCMIMINAVAISKVSERAFRNVEREVYVAITTIRRKVETI